MHFTDYAFHLLEIVPFLAGCLLWKKDWPLQFRQLAIMMGLTVFVEIVAHVLAIRHHNSMWLYNLFMPVECGSFLYVFFRGAVRPAIRIFNRCLLAAIIPVLVISFLAQPHLLLHNKFRYIIFLFLELLAACSFFIDLLSGGESVYLLRQPLFWLAGGIVPFCCVHIVLFSLLNYFIPMPQIYYFSWTLVANTFLYSGVTACFICLRRTRGTVLRVVSPITPPGPVPPVPPNKSGAPTPPDIPTASSGPVTPTRIFPSDHGNLN